MRANEFVNRFGWESAKNIVNSMPARATSYRVSENNVLGLGGLYGRISNINGNIISLIDLKRLVESHRLIEVEGGIDQVKDTFSFAYKHGADELTEYGKKLKQAIADVESCL